MHRNILLLEMILLVLFCMISPFTMGLVTAETELEIQSNHLTFNHFTNVGSTDWWPMFQHDLGTTGNSSGYAPSTPHLAWKYTTGYYMTASVSIWNNRVYFGSDDEQFYCLDAKTGSLLWQNSIPGGTSICQPSIVDGYVYMGTTYDYVYCWNALTGHELWRFDKGYGGMASPSVVNGRVYIGRDLGWIYCLNAQTGELIWKYDMGNYEVGSTAYGDGKIFIGSLDKHLYCFNADNGSLLWKFNTGNYAHGGPTFHNGRVFNGGGSIFCLDADTGTEIWSYPEYTWASPVISYGRLYSRSKNGVFYCLDAETGDLIWEYEISSYEGGASAPAVANELVYFASWDNGDLYCLDAFSGEIVWIYSIASGHPNPLTSSPTIADGYVYIGGCETYNVYAFNDVSAAPNEPIITGPHCGEMKIQYNFTAVSTDPDSDSLYYKWYWGDGTISDWLGPYFSGEQIVGSHQWNETGDYCVRVRTKDEFHVYSPWSRSHTMEINPSNQPPDIPIIDGPMKIRASELISFTFTSCDPENKELLYYIDWGDGSFENWFGPYPSGQSIVIDHKWDDQGSYLVRAKVKDELDLESEWGQHAITVPRALCYSGWQWLCERFPLLSQFLELLTPLPI